MKKLRKISRIDKIGAYKPRTYMDLSVTGGGVKKLSLVPAELNEMIGIVGERRAKQAWELKKAGIAGTLPELLTYQWLLDGEYTFEFQRIVGGMSGRPIVPDFIIFNMSYNGVYIWRVQGEYWHSSTVEHDRIQKEYLRAMKIYSMPVVAVVDLWETDCYDRYPEIYLQAEQGYGLRDYM